jgi:hypothetical protein
VFNKQISAFIFSANSTAYFTALSAHLEKSVETKNFIGGNCEAKLMLFNS